MCKTTNRLARLLVCRPALAIGILLTFPAAGFPQDDGPSKPLVSFSGAHRSAWQFLNQTKDPRLSMLQKFADAMKISLAELVK